MNAARRKELEKAKSLLYEAIEIITCAADEEQDYSDSMPENLQGSERFSKAEEISSTLQEISGELENQIAIIEEAAE